MSGVFSLLPCAFNRGRYDQSRPDRPPPRRQPQQPVERQPVDDMRERVPVGDVLRFSELWTTPCQQFLQIRTGTMQIFPIAASMTATAATIRIPRLIRYRSPPALSASTRRDYLPAPEGGLAGVMIRRGKPLVDKAPDYCTMFGSSRFAAAMSRLHWRTPRPVRTI